MPWNALLLIMVAAVLHAGWNIVAKRSGGGRHFSLLTALILSVLWAPVGLWVGWHELPRWGLAAWALVGLSAVLHVVYFLVLLRGYREADLTVVYPMARGTGPLLSATVAAFWLGERLGPAGWGGVAGVVLGVVLIAGGPKLWAALRAPAAGPPAGHEGLAPAAAALRVRAGIGWGAATGVMIAAYTLVDGYAVKVMLLSPILVDYIGNLLRVPLLLPGAWRDGAGFLREARAQWRAALVVAVCGPVAYVLVLYAAQMAPLSRVAPAREVSMLVAALIGGHLLGEGDRAWRLAGAACMALGVALLAW